MPLKKCKNSNVSGWQWGDNGTCYIGPDSKRNAVKQAIAIGEGKFFDMSQFNIDRSVFMFDVFDQYSSEDIIKSLLELDQAAPGEPINIFINSYGGEVGSMFAILDVMAGLNSQVNTICLGEADSCGAVLLSAGDFRYIGKNSRSMIHEVSAFSYGKITEMEDQIVLAKDVNDKLISTLAKNMGQDFTYLKDIMKKDVWLDAKETKDMGLVDFVMEEDAFDVFQVAFSNLTDMKQVYANSFNGRSKDGVVTKMLYNVTKRGGAVNSTRVNKNIMRGDEGMDKDKLLAELKDKFQIDVNASITDLVNVRAELETVRVENSSLKTNIADLNKEIVTIRDEQNKKEVEDLLQSLIKDCKATQVHVDSVYRIAFQNMSIEDAKKAANALPVIVNTTNSSTNVRNPGVDDSSNESEVDHQAIQRIVDTEKLSYNAAARKFYSEQKGEK